MKWMRRRMWQGRGQGQWEEQGAGQGDRGFPLLICSCREEDPGAGNRLDECVIPVENSGCHGQHSSLIRESGLQPHYSACLITAYEHFYQTHSLGAHTQKHTPSRCSPPVILTMSWRTHKVIAREEGKRVKGRKKTKACRKKKKAKGLSMSVSCLWFVFICKQSCCCEYVSMSLSH